MSIQTKTLSVRVKDKHAAVLRQMAFEVNQIFNLANEITSSAYSNAGAFLLVRRNRNVYLPSMFRRL